MQTVRIDYRDAGVRSAVHGLLDTSFPQLSDRIRIAERLGAVWHEVSTAFVAWVGDVPVAHVGVIPIPLVVDGERRTVAGVHAVCTRPEFRGRGLIRAILDEALAYVDATFDAALLTTSIPALYEPFGFRVVPEVVAQYRGPIPARSQPPRARAASELTVPESITREQPARLLSDSVSADIELLHRLLRQREPVSRTLCSVDPGWLFIINEVLASWGVRRVYYAEDLDVAFVAQSDSGTLTLLDVVGAEMPAVERLLETVPLDFDRVELHFVPDRVGGGPYETVSSDPDDCLMVRGSLTLAHDVMLPPLARC